MTDAGPSAAAGNETAKANQMDDQMALPNGESEPEDDQMALPIGTVRIFSDAKATSSESHAMWDAKGRPINTFLRTLTMNTLTCNIFEFLRTCGIESYYIKKLDGSSFLAKKLTMIPIELVARRVDSPRSTHSIEFERMRADVPTVFNPISIDMFVQDGDSRKLVKIDSILNDGIASIEFTRAQVSTIIETTRAVFEVLECVWREVDRALVEMKLEFGYDVNRDIWLGGIINNDTWRFWQKGDGGMTIGKKIGDADTSIVAINREFERAARIGAIDDGQVLMHKRSRVVIVHQSNVSVDASQKATDRAITLPLKSFGIDVSVKLCDEVTASAASAETFVQELLTEFGRDCGVFVIIEGHPALYQAIETCTEIPIVSTNRVPWWRGAREYRHGPSPTVLAARIIAAGDGVVAARLRGKRFTNAKDYNSGLGEMPTPFIGAGETPRTLLELQMMNVGSCLRSKPNWYTKINDAALVAKWREETIAQGRSGPLFDLAMQQLHYSAKNLSQGDIRESPVDRVFESDERVSEELRQQLIKAAGLLESADVKDWHPGTDEQVLDLVHPSLFCLVAGVSRRVADARQWQKTIGLGQPVQFPVVANRRDAYWSNKFQWLPTDVYVDRKGRCKFEGYINNLHPVDHRELYTILGRILERFVPMFAWTLTNARRPEPHQISVDPYGWYDEEFDWGEDTSNDSDANMQLNNAYEEFIANRQPNQPSIPSDYKMRSPLAAKDIVDLRCRKLQVIVKLANIELSPSKPQYDGGVWHVEGMKNESIVSSGIYYYSNDNITESRLQFRVAVEDPVYELGDEVGIRAIYGMDDEGSQNQEIGSVLAESGRCICFPNMMQHRVAPFRLADASRCGHRKILVFFLVDPRENIVSTSTVPPQQLDWYVRELKEQRALPSMPVEVEETIRAHMEFPITLDKAMEYRRELMKERKFCRECHNENVFERPFSLCEH